MHSYHKIPNTLPSAFPSALVRVTVNAQPSSMEVAEESSTQAKAGTPSATDGVLAPPPNVSTPTAET